MQQEDAYEEEVDYDFDQQADDPTGTVDAGAGSSNTGLYCVAPSGLLVICLRLTFDDMQRT